METTEKPLTISEIKSRISILEVLQHYDLHPNNNGMLNCPFHEDRTPSMQVYTESNKVYCFSSNCKLHGKAIDQIDFVMHKEGISKGDAIRKLSGVPTDIKTQPEASTVPGVVGDKRELLDKVYRESLKTYGRSPAAKKYIDSRYLSPELLGLSRPGYFTKDFFKSWSPSEQKTLLEIGLMKDYGKSCITVMGSCVVFPLRNASGDIVSLYGRSLNKGHYYLKGGYQGLYPGYPDRETKQLIITESVIDAATLLVVPEIRNSGGPRANHYEVLALYGTNGFTEEHREAISQLTNLDRVVLMLDGDESGRKASKVYSELLKELCPGVEIDIAELPEGEDVNSLLDGHDTSIYTHLLQRVAAENSPSDESPQTEQEPEEEPVSSGQLGGELLAYQSGGLRIVIRGGVETHNLHRLKLSLHLMYEGSHFRDEVNLYSHRSRKGFIEDASEELGVPSQLLKRVLEGFTQEVEGYRQKLIDETRKSKIEKAEVKLTAGEQREAIEALTKGSVIDYLERAMGEVGLIGEKDNGLLLFLIFLTRYFDNPLHALVHGSSGSGKTNLLKTILKLVPEESKYTTTALTENVLFRPPYKAFWKNKILLLEDLDGSYKALLPLREFMTAQKISKFASEPNPRTGKYEQVLLEAEGPICIAGATTKDRIYEDNSNRSFLIHVNESRSQQLAVLEYQNKQAAGLIDKSNEAEISRRVQNLQRVLQPIQVRNPYQPKLKLPEYVFKKLRTNTHYISLIQAVTFLNQYSRQVKQDEKGIQYIETTIEDIAIANRLSKASLLRKSDELSGQLRDFFESLKGSVKKKGVESFVSGSIRDQFRMHPMTLKRRLDELQNRGYIRRTGGNRRVGYEYEIIVWDDYETLKKGVDIVDTVLSSITQVSH